MQRAFLANLGIHLTLHGFNPKPVGQSFYRKVPGGRWAFHVSFIRHHADVDITADVAVRINAIEDVVNRYTTGLTKAEKLQSNTLGMELGNLSRAKPLRWTLSEHCDVAKIAEQVADAFERIGLPYLLSHSDVEASYRVLTSPAPEASLHGPILGARCMRTIAAAYVLGRTHEVAQLLRVCEAQLAAENDLYLSEFRALRDFLT